MKSWYHETLKMTPYQIKVVLDSFGRRTNGTRPKNIDMERVKYVVENFITTDNKSPQVEIANKFGIEKETARRHIERIARFCHRVCGKQFQ